jgi:hypothetical protein
VKKVDEIRGPSCLTRAADDEPLFVLRANDELASQTVLQWAIDYARSKQITGEFTEEQQRKYDDAVSISVEMRRWKSNHAKG